MKELKFYANKIHCQSCVVLIEDELSQLEGVKEVKVSLSDKSVSLRGDFGTMSKKEIIDDLNDVLSAYDYVLDFKRNKEEFKSSEIMLAIPIALLFVGLFLVLQKVGLVNIISADEFTLGSAFVIGVVASLSSCMAVVGGLVLSMSAKYHKEGFRVGPETSFHIGRLLGFFVLGGVIGVLGSAFTLGAVGVSVISLVVAVIMVLLGIDLLGVWQGARRFKLTIPKSVGARVHRLKGLQSKFAPFLLGVATFFLPCGFTQSMQIQALSTSSFLEGALMMLVFALGTLPVLLLLSFGMFGIKNARSRGVFYKTAGLVVIFFALVNIYGAMVAAGVINPIFNL